jgi:hypothetical protein
MTGQRGASATFLYLNSKREANLWLGEVPPSLCGILSRFAFSFCLVLSLFV